MIGARLTGAGFGGCVVASSSGARSAQRMWRVTHLVALTGVRRSVGHADRAARSRRLERCSPPHLFDEPPTPSGRPVPDRRRPPPAVRAARRRRRRLRHRRRDDPPRQGHRDVPLRARRRRRPAARASARPSSPPSDLAEERGCYGMWVLTDADNEAAVRTYQAPAAASPTPGPPRLDLRRLTRRVTCGRGGPASSGRTRPG